MPELPANLRHRLLLVRDLDKWGGDDRDLRRRRDKGDLVRVRRGCYLPAADWEAMSPRERHLARIHSVAANASIEPVFSHVSAAAVHGITMVTTWTDKVHVTLDPTGARRTQPDIATHALGLETDEIERRDGLLVTGLERTLVDLALTSSFQSAVVALDWALAEGVARSDLHAALERRGAVKRGRAAVAAIEFADARSGSAGESLSRGVMHLLGSRPPELQVPISDEAGVIGTVDFYWPEQRIIGEFDGRAKYERGEYLRGRTPGQVVHEEKVREDRMRATRRGFVRWGWDGAADPTRLGRILRDAGIPGFR
ncbi:MAG: type IV toxin-antitoxin system AbiEi family antitoxin domain-containing protein [Naasia sp.]